MSRVLLQFLMHHLKIATLMNLNHREALLVAMRVSLTSSLTCELAMGSLFVY
jgi:hypothetical protein